MHVVALILALNMLRIVRLNLNTQQSLAGMVPGNPECQTAHEIPFAEAWLCTSLQVTSASRILAGVYALSTHACIVLTSDSFLTLWTGKGIVAW